MPEGNEQPSIGLIALGAGAMVLCCLVPLVLLSVGAAGLAALIAGNAWWLLGGAVVLAGAILAARMRRPDASRARRPVAKSHIEEKGTAHD